MKKLLLRYLKTKILQSNLKVTKLTKNNLGLPLRVQKLLRPLSVAADHLSSKSLQDIQSNIPAPTTKRAGRLAPKLPDWGKKKISPAA